MISPPKPCRWVAAVVCAVLCFGAIAPAAAQIDPELYPDPPNSDYDVEQLELLVVDGPGNALDGGGGLTTFSIELEGEDQCPGDTTHDDYRIDSYMVPIEVDPTGLDFSGLGPHPPAFRDYESFQMPLQTTAGNGFAAELLGDSAEAGGPGLIRDIPPFDFHVYVPTPGVDDWEGGVPAGDYRVGLACTFAGRITNLWETTVEVADDRADVPVGMRWTVTGPQPLDLETAPSEPTALVAGLIAFAVVAAIAAFALHRSSRREEDPRPAAVREESVV